MALIQWNSTLSVNITQIDNQHMKLVELVNTLHDRMKEGKGKAALSGILNELTNYTVYHFKTEEDIFRKYNYPQTDAHLKEHDALVQQVVKLKADFDNGKSVLTLDVMNFLKDWLTLHIMGDDKAYTPFLKSQGIV
ncbi:MAG: hemerythrin [Stygiobacter sp. RIFOXYA12_FULL_38_9]|nr:MAG: hemerythrin [Stygiobacter sp. GWC2_38_9]OGU82615.1 MAG: hemerythrin [Stygiobacter sp. RIFOXYA12_FULL_38_9]OGV08003.1 MAG: hemerythrin [Stygiobacter sp. RIFOXYB2_FULL_37_11]OGV12230.1 MAG: hemerythrin [Stygiobacter sp. RIFOXYA2_FULL_38_8]OGV14279.1 MAG: hemerythrin [Stygiobacter sp. RIFOXYC2_FULL_38_25]OGV82443.1 MAG: hemerythrin [Stygiobacter sp. GWF2_38_21]